MMERAEVVDMMEPSRIENRKEKKEKAQKQKSIALTVDLGKQVPQRTT